MRLLTGSTGSATVYMMVAVRVRHATNARLPELKSINAVLLEDHPGACQAAVPVVQLPNDRNIQQDDII